MKLILTAVLLAVLALAAFVARDLRSLAGPPAESAMTRDLHGGQSVAAERRAGEAAVRVDIPERGFGREENGVAVGGNPSGDLAQPRLRAVTSVTPAKGASRVAGASAPAVSASVAGDPSPEGTRVVDAALGSGVRVDGARLGNRLLVGGVQVSVAAAFPAPADGAGSALALDVSAGAETQGAGSEASDGPTAGERPESRDARGRREGDRGDAAGGATGGLTVGESRDSGSGFSAEEEMFRLKWGWAAYDAAKREAVKQSTR